MPYRSLLVSFVLAAVLALPATASGQGTLNGEEFLDFTIQKCQKFDADGEADCFTPDARPERASAQCDEDATSRIQFSVAGVATGPYPGTFKENVTVTIGPQTLAPVGQQSLYEFGTNGFTAGPVISYHAEFTIYDASGNAIVSGTKDLAPTGAGNYGVCRRFDDEPADSTNAGLTGGGDITGYFTIVRASTLTYTATIRDPLTGVSRDSGTSDSTYVEFFAFNDQSDCANPFSICNPDDRVRAVGGGFGQRFYSVPADRPGLGCGDRNHTHEREARCKKLMQDDGIPLS